MKTSIKLKDLKQILDDMPKTKIKKEPNSWGSVTPQYKEMVDINSVMYHVEKYLKNKN